MFLGVATPFLQDKVSMLNLDWLVHDVLLSVLASIVEFLSDIIYKNLGFTQAFPDWDLKFSPDKRHQSFGYNLAFVLLSQI